jgi:hypothetical protein
MWGAYRQAFIDLTTNRTRQYCSTRCATRINVARFRQRQRIDSRGGDGHWHDLRHPAHGVRESAGPIGGCVLGSGGQRWGWHGRPGASARPSWCRHRRPREPGVAQVVQVEIGTPGDLAGRDPSSVEGAAHDGTLAGEVGPGHRLH